MALPFHAQGHLIPLMELSHRLVEQGFKIDFVNIEFNHDCVLKVLAEEGTIPGVTCSPFLMVWALLMTTQTSATVFASLRMNLPKLIEDGVLDETGKEKWKTKSPATKHEALPKQARDRHKGDQEQGGTATWRQGNQRKVGEADGHGLRKHPRGRLFTSEIAQACEFAERTMLFQDSEFADACIPAALELSNNRIMISLSRK
ncbi:hypothetical protein ABZP36_018785 [Zizania latifolia]